MPRVRRLFRRRTDALLVAGVATVVLLVVIGLSNWFLVVLVLIVAWALIFAIEGPLRQAYLNGIIPSEQRATVLSFDNLMGSAGGVVFQPILGRRRGRERLRRLVRRQRRHPGAGAAIHLPGPPREGRVRPDQAGRRGDGSGHAPRGRLARGRPGVCSEARATDREDPCRACSTSRSRARTTSARSRTAARR